MSDTPGDLGARSLAGGSGGGRRNTLADLAPSGRGDVSLVSSLTSTDFFSPVFLRRGGRSGGGDVIFVSAGVCDSPLLSSSLLDLRSEESSRGGGIFLIVGSLTTMDLCCCKGESVGVDEVDDVDGFGVVLAVTEAVLTGAVFAAVVGAAVEFLSCGLACEVVTLLVDLPADAVVFVTGGGGFLIGRVGLSGLVEAVAVGCFQPPLLMLVCLPLSLERLTEYLALEAAVDSGGLPPFFRLGEPLRDPPFPLSELESTLKLGVLNLCEAVLAEYDRCGRKVTAGVLLVTGVLPLLCIPLKFPIDDVFFSGTSLREPLLSLLPIFTDLVTEAALV